jgi:hypothetical protein
LAHFATSLKANNRLSTGTQQQHCEIALLLNPDLADPAPDGMFPTALMGERDG